MEAEEIKRRLRRTWHPFFSRFGRLTEVQLKTIPVVLSRRNALVISPAATGKTEAVVAPLCEMISPGDTPAILYISPTRALVNDVYKRLEGPLSMLGLKAGRRTGEIREGERKGTYIMITTPESFDSILARTPSLLKGVQVVILDEIHLVDGTPRGDMLRVLMRRLKLLLKRKILIYVLSATVERTDVGGRYMDEYEVINVRGKRKIEYLLIPESPDVPARLVQILSENGFKKVIVFFNSRSFVEGFSRKFSLPPFEGKVIVHHSSLARKFREDVESLMHTSRIGLICATTTLELGIDIGDVDCVVLYRPPSSVSSLLQRVGRGNRRRDDVLFAIGVYANRWEKILFEVFFDCAKDGRFYEKKYRPLYTVIPQQVFSYSFQKRKTGVTRTGYYRIFEGIFEKEAIDEFIEWALEGGFLREGRAGVLHLTPKTEKMIKYGKVHTVIMDFSPSSYEVIDADTGRKLGDVFYPQDTFILAGKVWCLVDIDRKNKKVFVRKVREEGDVTKIFEGVGFGTYTYELSGVLRGMCFPGIGERELPLLRMNNEEVAVAHFLGSIYSEVLTRSLTRERGIEFRSPDGLITYFKGEPSLFLSPVREIMKEVIADNLLKLQDALGLNGFFKLLPHSLQIMTVWNALDMDGFIKYLSTLSFKEYEEEEFKKVALSLAESI